MAQFFSTSEGLSGTFRPIPMLTFALNWYLGDGKLFGFHLVNNIVHCLSAFFLFLSVQMLLQTPKLDGKSGVNTHSVALLASVLWAVHPVQTQAVTYIVQRMAAMAAMFYILSFYFYLKARLVNNGTWKTVVFAAFSATSFALACLSKENAVMLPAVLILTEYIFFQSGDRFFLKNRTTAKRTMYIILAFGGIAILIPLLIWHQSIHNIIISIYEKRPFSITERLLTQPRIIFFYLSLLFYPVNHRLSIYHHFPISKSLIDPWSTLICMGGIVVLIVYACLAARKRPLISFAVLFYFLNHIIESSILGLELVYEHRNYLPSMFLFVLFSLAICQSLSTLKDRKSHLFPIMVFFIPFVIFTMGIATYTRNEDWRTEKSLWQNVLRQYPDTPRALNNLAYGHYLQIGDLDYALSLYQRSLGFSWKDDITVYRKVYTQNDIAGIYFAKGFYEKALSLWEGVLSEKRNVIGAMGGRVDANMALGRWNDASAAMDLVIKTQPPSFNSYNKRGFIAFKQGRYEEAIAFFRKALQEKPLNVPSLIYLGALYSSIENVDRSSFFLNMALSRKADSPVVLMLQLQNAIIAGNNELIQKRMHFIFNLFKTNQIFMLLQQSKEHFSIPLDLAKIVPVIFSAARDKVQQWPMMTESSAKDALKKTIQSN